MPACDDCHTDEDSRDVELFALQTAIDVRAERSAAACAIHASLIQSLAHPRKQGWLRRIVRSFSIADVYTPAGVYVGRFPSYELDVQRLQTVAARIIRGLYFHHWREPVPTTHEVQAYSADVIRRQPQQIREAFGRLLRFVANEPLYSLGSDTFAYRFRVSPDDPRSCVVLLVFYGGVPYLGWVMGRPATESRVVPAPASTS